MHAQKLLRHDGVLHEEILRVRVNAAEPRLMGRQRHAVDSLHARFVTLRQQLNDGYLVTHHQAVRARHLHAAGKRLLDGRKKTKQDKRHQNRKKRQRRAQFFPVQIAPYEVKKFHEANWSDGVRERWSDETSSIIPLLQYSITPFVFISPVRC